MTTADDQIRPMRRKSVGLGFVAALASVSGQAIAA